MNKKNRHARHGRKKSSSLLIKVYKQTNRNSGFKCQIVNRSMFLFIFYIFKFEKFNTLTKKFNT